MTWVLWLLNSHLYLIGLARYLRVSSGAVRRQMKRLTSLDWRGHKPAWFNYIFLLFLSANRASFRLMCGHCEQDKQVWAYGYSAPFLFVSTVLNLNQLSRQLLSVQHQFRLKDGKKIAFFNKCKLMHYFGRIILVCRLSFASELDNVFLCRSRPLYVHFLSL